VEVIATFLDISPFRCLHNFDVFHMLYFLVQGAALGTLKVHLLLGLLGQRAI